LNSTDYPTVPNTSDNTNKRRKQEKRKTTTQRTATYNNPTTEEPKKKQEETRERKKARTQHHLKIQNVHPSGNPTLTHVHHNPQSSTPTLLRLHLHTVERHETTQLDHP
jgi:hypothetical protein